jgi:hypothetical protein
MSGDAGPGSSQPSPGTPSGCPANPSKPAESLLGDDGSVHDPWPEVPPLTDADAPSSDDGHGDPPPEPCDDGRLRYGEDPLDLPDTGPAPAWPTIPATTGTRPLTRTGAGTTGAGTTGAGTTGAPSITIGTGTANGQGRPAAGTLDLTLSWATLAESSSVPGFLGRIGPVTATQARALAAASTAPGTRWRVILTNDHGHAVKTATISRRAAARARPTHGPAARTGKAPVRTTIQAPAAGAGTGGPLLSLTGPATGLTGRVSVTIPVTALDQISAAELAGTTTRAAVLRAAARAAARIRRQATTDQETDNGCAHTTASPAYRPPATIRDLVAARDQTCRFPGCRQPACRGDLDHTTPFHRGGLTCPCNLGPPCRRHHRLKQEQHWALTQTSPGTFRWHTPAGRIHTTSPLRHAP